MYKIAYLLTLTAVLALNISNSIGQNRWVKVYHDEIDAVGDKMIDSYDHGCLLLGRYGHNYPKYLWLIKTDINGEILWEKVLGDGINALVYLDLEQNNSGSIYLVGMNSSVDSEGDPIVMKLDSCGEKEWCRLFYTENNDDFASCLTLTPEGDVVTVLMLTNPEPWVERICLAKLSSDGDLLWKHCYTSADTNQRNEDAYNLIITPDHGFLISGFCYYEDPFYPDHWIPHPYFLKTDSTGIFEWETVVFKETNLSGGVASSSVICPDSLYYYASISHYLYGEDEDLASPALVKVNLQGEVIGVFDIVEGYKFGKLSYAQFLNDSTLAASAGWGNSEDDLWSRAVIIDTLGNLLNSTVLMQDLYTSILEVAFDGKLVYASNTYQDNQFDFYLTKLNQNLGQDSIYTRPFAYDSLCPYQIVSDTIVQDDCGLIVGIEEDGRTVGREDDKTNRLSIWPNPASGIVDCRWSIFDGRFDLTLMIYDLFGREIRKIAISENEHEIQFSVEDFMPGLFVIVLKDGNSIIGSAKMVVAR